MNVAPLATSPRTLPHSSSDALAAKIVNLRTLLQRIERDHSPAAFASSFGAEDMVLTDLIAREFRNIKIFTLNTFRLPKQTLALVDVVRKKYDVHIDVYAPTAESVENFERRNGHFSMYDNIDNRKACCQLRKVEPLKRALTRKKAWLTGLRREQAPTRQNLGESEFDAAHGITKFNPLIDWRDNDVWAYIRAHNVPYNALHDQGYPSIGCEPCTRAIKPDEDVRAGRWWWENSDAKECGLHTQAIDASRPNVNRAKNVGAVA